MINECIIEGEQLCSSFLEVNSNDYLTNKAINELSKIIDNAKLMNIDEKIDDIKIKVAKKEQEIIELENNKLDEQSTL